MRIGSQQVAFVPLFYCVATDVAGIVLSATGCTGSAQVSLHRIGRFMIFGKKKSSGTRKLRALGNAVGAVIETIEARVLMSASSLDTTFGALHNGKVTQN